MLNSGGPRLFHRWRQGFHWFTTETNRYWVGSRAFVQKYLNWYLHFAGKDSGSRLGSLNWVGFLGSGPIPYMRLRHAHTLASLDTSNLQLVRPFDFPSCLTPFHVSVFIILENYLLWTIVGGWVGADTDHVTLCFPGGGGRRKPTQTRRPGARPAGPPLRASAHGTNGEGT